MVFHELLWSTKYKVLSKMPLSSNTLKNKFLIMSDDSIPHSSKLFLNVLEEIVQDYEEISKFIDVSFSENKFEGYYIHAFRCGISTILNEFSSIFCEIEELFLNDSNFTLIHIMNKLEYIHRAISNIKIATQKVQEGKFFGCTILDLCEEFINSGCSVVQKVFRRIQYFCFKPFYQQVKLWIMLAHLNDKHSEFFIRESNKDFDFVNNYTLNIHRIPALLPLSVAKKILFIGESLIMCRQHEFDINFPNEILILSGLNEVGISFMFSEIEGLETFSLCKFTFLIDDVWFGLNKHIRKAADEVGDLCYQLTVLWEIYLLGRGELFQEFLTKASHLLNSDASKIDSQNLNVTLRDAFYDVYLSENVELMDNFSFKIPFNYIQRKGLETMCVMRLEYKVKWPLDYLFTSDVISKYNAIFLFLLRLKKAQLNINGTWKIANKINNIQLRMEVTEIRLHLLSVIGNLQNYCFTNVITKEMNVLMESVKSTNIFTDIKTLIYNFLDNILLQFFLNTLVNEGHECIENDETVPNVNKSVNACFMKIFKLCEQFSIIIKNNDIDEIMSLKDSLHEVSNNLIVLLQHKDNNNYFEEDSNVHLYDLIMCLDYNGFFRKNLEKFRMRDTEIKSQIRQNGSTVVKPFHQY